MTPARRMRRRGGTVLAITVVLGAGAILPARVAGAGARPAGSTAASTNASMEVPTAGGASPRPNVLFVLADDLDLASLAAMPEVQRLVAAQGATFDDYFVSNSLCCPSRATTLTGRYAHNTGVQSNGGSNGGFRRAYVSKLEGSTIATRLRDAGYRTGLFGKYLNGYPDPAGKRYVPPGWTDWASPVAGSPYSEYKYTLNQNGQLHAYGDTPADYGTDVYLGLARTFVEQSVGKDRPFFAYVAPFVPHLPATPAPSDLGRFAGLVAPRTPSFDQPDVTGMPVLIRNLPRFTPAETAAIDTLYERRIESLQALDRGVASLVDTLTSLGALRNTYVVFASDNGFHLGQHRLPAGKELPYDTDVHVPLVVRGPGIAAGTHVSELTSNVDLAPTFAAMGGAARSRSFDGGSLLGLMRGHRSAAGTATQAVLLEHWAQRRGGRLPSFVPFGGMLEPSDPDQTSSDDARFHPTAIAEPVKGGTTPLLSDQTLYSSIVKIPDYVGVRTDRYLYVEYVNGDRELYDTVADPDEMHNLAGTLPELEARLGARVAAMRSCAGHGCRAALR